LSVCPTALLNSIIVEHFIANPPRGESLYIRNTEFIFWKSNMGTDKESDKNNRN
jgi:hypothetical protein